MASRINSVLNKVHPILWQGCCIAISIVVFSLILINRSPNFLRPLSMSLRTGFGLVIPATAIAIYLVYRLPGRSGELISMTAVLSLFAMPLAGVWASGKSQSVLFNGLIPLADASNYYIDGLRILAGMDISHFSAMRPIFPGFLSLLLDVTGRNLMFSLAIITAIAGLSAFFATRELQGTHGAESASFLLIILFLYYRHHTGTTMSETLGVSVGALGMGLTWRGLGIKSSRLAIFGLFVITLALNIRPGTMFVLPLILLWIGWVFKRNKAWISLKVLIWGMGAIILGFIINSLLIRWLADPSGTAFSNFSWALYGLASGGKSFNYIFGAHPEVLNLQDPQQSRTIYRLAFDLMLHRPELFISGMLQRWSYFFSDSWHSAYSFVSGEDRLINTIARWCMYILCALGFLRWVKNPRDNLTGLAALAAIGVLVSVPFVPPTDAYRVRLYAATIVVFGLLPSLGIVLIFEQLKFRVFSHPDADVQKNSITAAFSAILVIIILVAPILSRLSNQRPPSAGFSCPNGMQKTLIRFDPGASFNVVRDNKVFLDWMPNFHAGLIIRNSHDLADTYIIQYLEDLNPPISLIYSLDYLSNRGTLIIAPTDNLPKPGTFIGLCGVRVDDNDLASYNIFYASHIVDLNEHP